MNEKYGEGILEDSVVVIEALRKSLVDAGRQHAGSMRDSKIVLAKLREQIAMTNGEHGVIDKDWLDACRYNETERSMVQDWFMSVLNCRYVCIYEDRTMWVSDSQVGHWMSQEEIDHACKQIDEGI